MRLSTIGFFALSALGLGCGDELVAPGGTGGSDSGGATSTGGQGGEGGAGSNVGGSSGGGEVYVPTPEDVGFVAMNPVPQGEQIIYNDWSFPDQVKSMAPDGSGATPIFSIYRVWSLGVSRAGDRIAFACGDPLQEEHYGLNLGDAIQHTWIYDMASQTVQPIAYGNINDECHHFGPSDDYLYLCRRYDFAGSIPDPVTFSGYRIGRIDIAMSDSPTMGFEWLLPESTDYTLNPQVLGTTMYFERIVIAGASQHRTIEKLDLPSGSPSLVIDAAYRPRLSPDGTKLLFADATQGSTLFVAGLEGQAPLMVAASNGTSPTWSPDGSRIAYLSWDDATACAHVEVVEADGSTATSPERIVDCSRTGESITQIEWMVRP